MESLSLRREKDLFACFSVEELGGNYNLVKSMIREVSEGAQLGKTENRLEVTRS